MSATMKDYHRMVDEHAEMIDCFWAFNIDQYRAERAKIDPNEKIYKTAFNGLFGTKKGLDNFFKFYDEKMQRIGQECRHLAQEIYDFEFWNFESEISWDGDENAIKTILDYFGYDEALKIKRKNAVYSLETILERAKR